MGMNKKVSTLGAFTVSVHLVSGTSIPLPCPEFNENIPTLNVTWENRGPAGYYPEEGLQAKAGDDDYVIELLSAGAIQDVVEGEDGTWYVGTVNGGVWQSTDSLAGDVHWEPVTDNQPVRCSSISAIATGKAAGHPEIVVAGCGASTSSEQGSDWNVVNSGSWGGVMFSIDSGKTWAMHDGMEVNYYISSVKMVQNDDDDDITLLVSARSNFYDKDQGGLWRGSLMDTSSPFTQVLSQPIFDLAVSGQSVLATVPFDAQNTILLSTDGGVNFASWSSGLSWSTDAVADMQPFYPAVEFNPEGTMAFMGALTVDPNDATTTSSKVFFREVPSSLASGEGDDSMTSLWVQVMGGPNSLDDDKMPKDRMAILPDPTNASQMYVVGNGDHVAWRVDYANGVWVSMIGDDTGSNAEPHVDCRNLAFQAKENRLLLTSDGGLFVRDVANQTGGVWRSGNGDINSLEFIDAKYNPFQETWIAGAQDNMVQISSTSAEAFEPALGVVQGDGTITAIDYNFNPPRMFGCIQFLGQQGDDARRRRLQTRNKSSKKLVETASTFSYSFDDTTDDQPVTADDEEEEDDDNDGDYSGLRMIQGSLTIDIYLLDYFKEESQFPFFVQDFSVNPYASEGGYNGTKLVLWVNGSSDGTQPAGFYEYSIPDTAKTSADIGEPKLLAACADNVFAVVSGGVFTDSNNETVVDDSLIVGLSNNQLFVMSSQTTDGSLVAKSLPIEIATPVGFTYDADGAPILGPVTHGKVASLSVAPHNANIIAVTGWSSVADNGDADSNETIYVTFDGGNTWSDVYGNLGGVVASVGKVRPSSLLLVPTEEDGVALYVGTVNGVYVTFLTGESSNYFYSRVGGCGGLPLVLVMGLSYEPLSDTVMAATFGRGVYSFTHAEATRTALRY